jgi:hypothetical protein
VNDLVAAIKANPGKFKASGTGQGGIWHLAIAGMLKDLNVDPASVPWVPSQGAAPGLLDLVAGGVQIAPVSLPEARAMIDAGKVKKPRRDGRQAGVAVSQPADAESSDGKQLDDGRVAWNRRAEETFLPKRATSSSPHCRRSWRARTTPSSWESRAMA